MKRVPYDMAHMIWPIFQLVKTFKILSFNRTAFFRPRNESVLEKVNELPALTSWANPTNWEKIIKSTNNYSDLIDEKERFHSLTIGLIRIKYTVYSIQYKNRVF